MTGRKISSIYRARSLTSFLLFSKVVCTLCRGSSDSGMCGHTRVGCEIHQNSRDGQAILPLRRHPPRLNPTQTRDIIPNQCIPQGVTVQKTSIKTVVSLSPCLICTSSVCGPNRSALLACSILSTLHPNWSAIMMRWTPFSTAST